MRQKRRPSAQGKTAAKKRKAQKDASISSGVESERDLCFVHSFPYGSWRPSGVLQMRVAPDGELLALGRGSGRVEIWETRHWSLLKVLPPRENVQWTGMVWLKGPVLVASTLDGRLFQWRLEKTETVRRVEEVSGGGIWAMTLTGDDRLGLACDDGVVRIYRFQESVVQLEGMLQSESSRALCLSWSGDGAMLAVGYAVGCVRLWSVAPTASSSLGLGHESLKLDLQKGTASLSVWSVLLLDEMLICGDSEGCVYFWDRRFGSLLSSFRKHEAHVTLLMHLQQQAQETEYLLSSGMDGSIVIYHKKTDAALWSYLHLRRPRVHDMTCWAVCERESERTFLTGSEDCLVHLMTVPNTADLVQALLKKRRRTLDATPERPIFQCAGERVLMAASGQTVDLWKLPPNPEVELQDQVHGGAELEGSGGAVLLARLAVQGSGISVLSAALSPDLQFLSISTVQRTKLFEIKGLDRASEQPICFQAIKTKKTLPAATQLFFSPEHLWLVDEGNRLKALSLQTLRICTTADLAFPETAPFGPSLANLSASPSGKLAYTVQDHLYVYALHLSGPRLLRQFCATSPIRGMTFYNDAALLIVTAAKELLHYDVTAGTLVTDTLDPGPLTLPSNEELHSLAMRGEEDLLIGCSSSLVRVDLKEAPHRLRAKGGERCKNRSLLPTSSHLRYLHLYPLTPKTLLTIHADWNEVLQSRPPPVYRHRYGT